MTEHCAFFLPNAPPQSDHKSISTEMRIFAIRWLAGEKFRLCYRPKIFKNGRPWRILRPEELEELKKQEIKVENFSFYEENQKTMTIRVSSESLAKILCNSENPPNPTSGRPHAPPSLPLP